MKILDPGDLRAIQTTGELWLCQSLLLAVTRNHRALTWGSRQRRVTVIPENGRSEELPSFLPSTLRSMTRTVEYLASIDARQPGTGRFEFLVGERSILIDVEIRGEGFDKTVVLRRGPATHASEDATSLLQTFISSKMSIMSPSEECEFDDRVVLRPLQDDELGGSHPLRQVLRFGRIVLGLLILPIVSLIKLISSIPCGRLSEHSRLLNAGSTAIRILEVMQPHGQDDSDWCCAVNLTLMAYVESIMETDIHVMRRITEELEKLPRGSVNAGTLTEFWDFLQDQSPRGRAFVVRHGHELMEYLGGPIML